MAGGQEISVGQGSLQIQQRRGQQIDSAQGSMTAVRLSDTQSSVSGEASAGFQEPVNSSRTVRLFSRRVGGGSATGTLSGSAWFAQSTAPIASFSRTPLGLASSTVAGTVGRSRTVALSGSVAASSGGFFAVGGSTLTPIQVNLAGEEYFDPTPIFVDPIVMGFGLMVKGTSTPAAVNPADGWPTGDFEVVSQAFPALTAPGTWTVEFDVGVGNIAYTIRAGQVGDTLTVGTWNSVTKKQVVTYSMIAGRPTKTTACIQLTGARRVDGVSGGVSGIRSARPGYTLADLATKTYTDEFLASIAKLRVLRMMNWQVINGEQNFGQGQDFSKRPTPTNRRSTYSSGEDPTGATLRRIGHSLETICGLANLTGKDIWICLPIFATDTYVAQVASFLHANLTGGQKVYIEWVNELWNFSGGFQHFDVLLAKTAAELNGFVDNSARTVGQNTRYIVSASRTAGIVTLELSTSHTYVANGSNKLRMANIDGITDTTAITITGTPAPNRVSFARPGPDGVFAVGQPTAQGVINSSSFIYDDNTTSNLVSGATTSRSLLDAKFIYAVRRTKEFGEIFRSVVGDANMRTRYIPTFCWQSVNTEFERELRWLKQAYPAQDPGYYIMACGHAPYFSLDGTRLGLRNLAISTDTTTVVPDYTTILNATAKLAKLDYGYEEKVATCLHYSTPTNPIELIPYEGGPDTSFLGVHDGESLPPNGHPNNSKKSQSQIDPNFQPAMAEFYRDIMRYGTNGTIPSQFQHGEGDPNSALMVDRWWSTDSIGNTSRPKIAAMFQVASEVRPVQPRWRGLGTFDARLRAGKYSDIDPNLTNTGTFPWILGADINFNTQSLTYVWDETATVATQRTISIVYTCNFSSWVMHVDINGTRVAASQALTPGDTSPNPPVTEKTLGPFTFTSRPGKNSIRLVRAGGGAGRDGQIRRITVAAVTVGASSLDQDWTARSTAAGVFLAQNFNTQASVTNNVWPDATASRVVWERIVKRSGNGSCRFNKLAEDGAASGLIRLPFDLTAGGDQNHTSTVSRGIGTETWYQGTFFMSEALLRWKPTYGGGSTGASNGGIKMLWVSGGGNSSNVNSEVVTNNGFFAGFVQAYYQNAGGSTPDFGINFASPNNSSNRRLWPAVDDGTPATPTTDAQAAQRYGHLFRINDPGYSLPNFGLGPSSGDVWGQGYPNPDVLASGVQPIPADGWITIQLRIKRIDASNTEIQVWSGKPGTTPVCTVNSTVPLGPADHGALWVGCYDTARDPSSPGVPDGYMLVTELIASTQPIAWPAVAEASPTWKTTLLDTQPTLTWVRIPNTNIGSVTNPTVPVGGGASGLTGKINAWTSFAFDQRTCDWYSPANGGHGDYAGNEVDRIRLLENTPAWAELRAYTTPVDVNVNRYTVDGRPTSRHSYYGVFFNEFRGRVMLAGGAGYGAGNAIPLTEGFDPVVGDWDCITGAVTYPNLPNVTPIQSHGMCMDPKTGDIYDPSHFEHYRWNNKSNSISNLAPGGAPSWAQKSAVAFDTKRRRMFIVGGGDVQERRLYDPATNTFSQPTLSGAAAATVQAAQQAGMEYVPRLDAFIMAIDSTLYRIDAGTFACTQLTTTVVGSMPAVVNSIFRRFVYSKKLDCCFIYPAYGSDVWAIRLPAS